LGEIRWKAVCPHTIKGPSDKFKYGINKTKYYCEEISMGQEIDKNHNSLQPSVEHRSDGTARATSRWKNNKKGKVVAGNNPSREVMSDVLKGIIDDTTEEQDEFNDLAESDGWDENEGEWKDEPTVEDVVSFLDKEGQLKKPKNYKGSTFDPSKSNARRLDWDKFLSDDFSGDDQIPTHE
jgi:hypothetical protein